MTLRIVQVCTGYPPDRKGGVENAVSTLAGILLERGHRVSVLTRLWRDKANHQESVFRIRTTGGEATGYSLWALKALRKIRFLNPEIVHCHGLEGAILCNLLRFSSVKKVVHIHNSLSREVEFFNSWRHRVGYTILKSACEVADAVICPTQVVKKDVLKHIPSLAEHKIHVIPYMVTAKKASSDEQITKLRNNLCLEGKKIILYFGRIKRTKGVEEICKAYRLMGRRDVALIIAGAPTRTENFLNYLRTSYPEVLFQTSDFIEHDAYHKLADLFCIYTTGFDGGETFAIAIAEAMSYGIAIVCADNPIFREVTGGNAFFAPPNSVMELATSISEALDNHEKATRHVSNASKVALQYSSENFVNRIEELYNTIIDQRK